MREYQGIGEVTLPNVGVFKGNFKLGFESSGKPIFSLTTSTEPTGEQLSKLFNLPWGVSSFQGTSTNPFYEVQIEKMYIKSFNSNGNFTFDIFHPIVMDYCELNEEQDIELRCGLSNLLFYGTEGIHHGSTWRGFCKTTWQLSEREFSLEQLPSYDDTKKRLGDSQEVSVTCELRTCCPYKAFTDVTKIFVDLQELFSIASGNYVTALYQDIISGGQLCKTILLPAKTYRFSSWYPLIDFSIACPKEFKDFIDITYPNYIALRDNLGLPRFVEFFVTSKIYSPLEIEYLLSTTAFECLEGCFRKWKSLNRVQALKIKIKRMCDFFSCQTTEKELENYNKCRNSITHEGKFPSDVDMFLCLLELRHLLDRFILIILGYKNKPYYNVVAQRKDSL